MSISQDLRQTRLDLGLTQRQLGAKLHVHPNTVARWERGEVGPFNAYLVEGALFSLREEANRRAYESSVTLEDELAALEAEADAGP